MEEMWNDMDPPHEGGIDAIKSYIDRVFNKVPELPSWKPFAVQAFWQQVWSGSNILATIKSSSEINKWLENSIKDKRLGADSQALGALEINWICESGLAIATQIAGLPGAMTTISTADRAGCITECVKANAAAAAAKQKSD